MRRMFQGRAGIALAFILGLVIATAGSATAAKLITGKQIKVGSISAKDLSKAVRAQLAKAGTRGAKGEPGPSGETGAPGPIQGTPAGGALAGVYPAPTIAAASAPVSVAENPNGTTDPCAATIPTTLVLCGTSSVRWTNGGFGVPGIEVWRDRTGQVHIRGSATVSSTLASAPTIFRLPEDLRPKRLYALPIATGQTAGAHQSGEAILLVYPDDGYVAVYSASDTAHRVVHLGEITFRTDA